jgi:hypothetical protein
MKLTVKEVEAKQELIAVMRKHKLETYRDEDAAPPLVVQLVAGKDNVKVRREDDQDQAEEE